MKKQNPMDRKHESMDMKYHLNMEHHRHGERLHQEMAMHQRHHGMYRNEEERPKEPAQGHMIHGMGMEDFKAEADPIAYGQAASAGVKSDNKKIHSQFKEYHWD